VDEAVQARQHLLDRRMERETDKEILDIDDQECRLLRIDDRRELCARILQGVSPF